MNSSLKSLVFVFTVLLPAVGLVGCANRTSTPQDSETIASVEQRLFELMQQLSTVTRRQQTLSPISPCRYEISTHWSSLNKGIYRAKNTQRFSFRHDIRAIEHSPNYTLTFGHGDQTWQEMIELSFNRPLPVTFSYIDSKDFQPKVEHNSNDQFSLLGYNMAPPQLMAALQSSFQKMALLCGNDTSKIANIDNKIIGRWDIYGQSKSHGSLIIGRKNAVLQHQDNATIEGPYTIENKDSHYLLTINPNNSEQRYHIMLDFMNSYYARLLLRGKENDDVNFAPYFGENNPDNNAEHNPNEMKLFRLGDLR